MDLKKRLLWLVIWGVSFGYIESAVVVYLREIYYPNGFSFPLVPIDKKILAIETAREAATLVLLWSTAVLSYKRLQSRVAAFFIMFGIWDIFYYIFLKMLLDWPQSLSTWDILFLIPLPWVGPVWAPVAVSAALIIFSVVVLYLNERGVYPRFSPLSLLLGVAGAGTVIASFIIAASAVLEGRAPEHFPVPLFVAGYLLGLFSYAYALYRTHSLHDKRV